MSITSDIQQQIFDLLSKSSNVSFISADQEPGGITGLLPGQRVSASVLATMPDNRVQVQIGSDRYNLNLPLTVRQGQSLDLTFVSSEPRTTFAMARQGGGASPVSLSDASRLLGLLADGEQIGEFQLRPSLHSIVDILRSAPGDSGVLANLLDEALTYTGMGGADNAAQTSNPVAAQRGGASAATGITVSTPGQQRLAVFEANASQLLRQIAQTSRFALVEAAGQPSLPLSLAPGQEVDALVQGTLPGGRTFVTVAGSSMELVLPRAVEEGQILRLTVIASQPKPVFALQRTVPETAPGMLSEAGRWLSVLEHTDGGMTNEQRGVLERLARVLENLPPDSPAFTAIYDDAITYTNIADEGRAGLARSTAAGALVTASQSTIQQGNGIVLSDDMAKLVQALIKGNRLSLLEALSSPGEAAVFSPGQQLKGEVLSALGGGRFLAQVAGQVYEFSLPKGIGVSDRLTLFFAGNDPRPTFLMTRFGMPGDSRVSDTGRWLSGLPGFGVAKGSEGMISAGIRALFAGPPADPAQAGAALEQGLRESGLFYESHLARWFGGEYALDDLLKEPQGKLSRLGQRAVAPMPPEGREPALLAAEAKTVSLEAMEMAFRKAGSVSDHEQLVDQRSLQMVREQLQSLQSGQVAYRGDLVAGHPFQWTVEEREARRNSTGERERNWDTILKVDLPTLGHVTVRATLDAGNRVTVDLSARDLSSVETLENGRNSLAEALQAAGLDAGEIGVHHGPS